jgi:putative Mn2+ efflux pump MntP
VIRLVAAGIFVGFGLLGVGAVLPSWLPSLAVPVVLLGLAVATLAAAHTLFLQRSRVDAHVAGDAAPSGHPRHLSQLLFAGLLIVGWGASLGLLAPLADVDHWFAFALLAGLGWKLIHGSVRLRTSPPVVATATAALVLLLTGLTFVDVLVPGVPLPVVIAPVSILFAAVLVLLGSPSLARRTSGALVRRVAEERVTIASGLLLLGIATQILIEHLR